MIKLECPKCRAKLKAEDEVMGQEITCPRCHNRFPVGLTADAARALENARILESQQAAAKNKSQAIQQLPDLRGEAINPPITKAPSLFRKWVAAHPLTSAGITGAIILIFLASIVVVYFSGSGKSQSGTILSDATQIGTIPPDRLRELARSTGMKMLNTIGDDFFAAEKRGETYFRCVWKPTSDGGQITEIFISNTGAKHGVQGQRPVLDLWQQICPALAEKMEERFAKPRAQSWRRVWIGNTPYAYGVDWNNKAFVEFVGPQGDIPHRRQLAIAAANVQINWFLTIRGLQEKMAAELPQLSDQEAKKSVTEQMATIISCFENVPLSVSLPLKHFTSGLGMDSKHLGEHPHSRMIIPGMLPASAQSRLREIASAIAAIARLCMFIVRDGKSLTFNPYDHMYMAFMSRDISRCIWGKYRNMEGFLAWGALPKKQEDGLTEIASYAISALRTP